MARGVVRDRGARIMTYSLGMDLGDKETQPSLFDEDGWG